MSAREALLKGYREGLRSSGPRKKKPKKVSLSQSEILKLRKILAGESNGV